jgi:hypothetical protein
MAISIEEQIKFITKARNIIDNLTRLTGSLKDRQNAEKEINDVIRAINDVQNFAEKEKNK